MYKINDVQFGLQDSVPLPWIYLFLMSAAFNLSYVTFVFVSVSFGCEPPVAE